MFIQTLLREKTGIYFIDSLLMKVCHIKRTNQHRVFRDLAKKSKSTIGWFQVAVNPPFLKTVRSRVSSLGYELPRELRISRIEPRSYRIHFNNE